MIFVFSAESLLIPEKMRHKSQEITQFQENWYDLTHPHRRSVVQHRPVPFIDYFPRYSYCYTTSTSSIIDVWTKIQLAKPVFKCFLGSEVDDEDNGSESEESSIDSWSNLNGENDSTNAILK